MGRNYLFLINVYQFSENFIQYTLIKFTTNSSQTYA